jgi:transposase InsO family protein
MAGKVIVIAGASSGMGAAAARHLVAKGASVVPGARRSDRIAALAAEIIKAGGKALAVATNVTKPEDLGKLVGTAVGIYGRVAFAIDSHDREIMAPVATVGVGISGEMVRDIKLQCSERRFDDVRATKPVQWLADNGAAYTAAETVDFATALNLVACLTPVRSPERVGVCEASVKTFKRDDVRLNAPRMRSLSCSSSPPLSTIITPSTPFAACTCSRRMSSSPRGPLPKPRVRSDGVQSTGIPACLSACGTPLGGAQPCTEGRPSPRLQEHGAPDGVMPTFSRSSFSQKTSALGHVTEGTSLLRAKARPAARRPQPTH